MKLTKRQKEIIKRIQTGDIYDIFSYIKYFNLGHIAKFDKEEIINSFNSDKIPKKYYCNNSLKLKYSNIVSDIDFIKKVQQGEVNPDNYSTFNLHLSNNSGIKHEFWENIEYSLNFYEGVYIANCFNDILEFLTLWQFLISEMLILEIPHTLSADTLGLFYTEDSDFRIENLPLEERIKKINFQDFSYDDQYYLHKNYVLSQEHCLMCKEFMNKRIYPSAKLGIFIAKHFTTYEESTQNKALFVAWLAIFVSVGLTFIPYFQQSDKSDIKSGIKNSKDIKSSIESTELDVKLSDKLDIIIKKLDILLDKITSKSITTDFENTNTPSECSIK